MRPVIVIFGAAVRPDGSPSGAMRGRVEAALALANVLLNPIFMPTGGQGQHGPPEAAIMTGLLLAAGIPPDAIRPEPTGRNTIRSARACARLLRPTNAQIYVATSSYHMLRCVTLLRLSGLRARKGRAPPRQASARLAKRWYWRLRELPALPLDAALMSFWRLSGRL